MQEALLLTTIGDVTLDICMRSYHEYTLPSVSARNPFDSSPEYKRTPLVGLNEMEPVFVSSLQLEIWIFGVHGDIWTS